MPLLIKKPLIVNAGKSNIADILIDKGIIVEISGNIDAGNHQIIDAGGLYAFPGGIDPHVHLQLPTPAGNSSDDFRSGTIAALAGGTTTIIDFVTPKRGQSHTEALRLRKSEATASLTDYSLHGSIVSLNENTEEEVRICIEEEGITSFKTYLAYRNTVGIDYETLRKVMQIVKKHNGLVTIHCEDGDEISRLQQDFLSKGQTSPLYHALSRPEYTEYEAVAEVLKLSQETGCNVYIVHISAKRSLELIAPYRSSGKIFTETCPHYLLLDDSNYQKPLPDALKYVISPPNRKNENIEALWQHITDGTIDVLSTDHCPFHTFGQKDTGADNFTLIPNGAGGIEYRLALLYTYGVLEKRISLNRFTELISANAAKIFGLYPQKGIIAPGSDADIVLWNPATEKIISRQTQYQNCDSNIYEGIPVKGSPEYVIGGGKIVFAHEIVSTEGLQGRFLKRQQQRMI